MLGTGIKILGGGIGLAGSEGRVDDVAGWGGGVDLVGGWEEGGVDLGAGPAAGGVDLGEVFPAGGGQGGRQDGETVGGGVAGGAQQAGLEAGEAARAALGLVLEPQRREAAPVCVLVIVVDDYEPERLRVARALVLAVEVLFQREDVGVGLENGRRDTLLEHNLDDGGGARRAAGVQQHTLGAPRHLQNELVLWDLNHYSTELMSISPFSNAYTVRPATDLMPVFLVMFFLCEMTV